MRPVLLPLLVAVALGLSAGAARADEPASPADVKDGAGLFTPEAVAQAESQIAELRHHYHLDLVVETFPALPPMRKWYFWDRRERNHFLENWATERARAAGVNGIYIEVCNHPRDVHVVVWPRERSAEFTARDCERVRQFLVRRLQAGSADQALLATVTEVGDMLEARATGLDDESLSANAFVLAGIVGGLFGVWAVLRLVRLRLRRAAPDGGARESAERAAERPARMAAMFGTPAAAWACDKLILKLPPLPAPPPVPLTETPAAADHAGEVAADTNPANAPVEAP